jgi:hypothetical protein
MKSMDGGARCCIHLVKMSSFGVSVGPKESGAICILAVCLKPHGTLANESMTFSSTGTYAARGYGSLRYVRVAAIDADLLS